MKIAQHLSAGESVVLFIDESDCGGRLKGGAGNNSGGVPFSRPFNGLRSIGYFRSQHSKCLGYFHSSAIADCTFNWNTPISTNRNKNTIMVTGSRDVHRETARTLFEHHLSAFISGGRIWLLGGARGIDQWAMEWLLEQNEACWIVIPYTRAHQPRSFHPWFEQVERVVELQLPKRKNAYAIRNRHMVDLSQIVFGFWSGQGGSTVKTLKHALRKRREVHAIPVFLNSGDV